MRVDSDYILKLTTRCLSPDFPNAPSPDVKKISKNNNDRNAES